MKFLLLASYCFLGFLHPSTAQVDSAFALGNPLVGRVAPKPIRRENAVWSPDSSSLLLLHSPAFTVAYSLSANCALFVAWHLQGSDMGPVPRYEGIFIPDSRLPKGAYKVRHNDYNNTNCDRGHLCPSADRTATPELQKQTFLLTNIVPQADRLNQQTWAYLEGYTRLRVASGSEAYIVAGVWGNNGTIGGKLTVPGFCWKVILFLPQGETDLSRIASLTDVVVVAVWMPNSELLHPVWQTYRVSVCQIEQYTGLRFFGNLPEVQRQVLINR